MTRVRALDDDKDWTFGRGQNDYLKANKAVIQNIETRLNMFLGDCFFDSGAGIDWFGLLGSKDQLSLQLAISAVILNTKDVTGLLEIYLNLSTLRRSSVSYSVQTVYSRASGLFRFDISGSL